MLSWGQIAAAGGVFEWNTGWKIALIVIHAVALAALITIVIWAAVAHSRRFKDADIVPAQDEHNAFAAPDPAEAPLPPPGEFAPMPQEQAAEPPIGLIIGQGAAAEGETAPPFVPFAEEPAEGDASGEPEAVGAEEPEPEEELAPEDGAEAYPAEEFGGELAAETAADGANFEAPSEGAIAAGGPAEGTFAVLGVGYRSGKRRNLSFEDKLAAAEPEMREMYAALKEELLSYRGVKSRISHGWDTFKYQKKKVVAKFSMAGKRIMVHLALDPSAYTDAKFPVEDKGDVSLYADTPMAVKVRGASTFKFVKRLIADLAAKEGMER